MNVCDYNFSNVVIRKFSYGFLYLLSEIVFMLKRPIGFWLNYKQEVEYLICFGTPILRRMLVDESYFKQGQCPNLPLIGTWWLSFVYKLICLQSKRTEEIWLSPMTKTPTPVEVSKGNVTIQTTPHKYRHVIYMRVQRPHYWMTWHLTVYFW